MRIVFTAPIIDEDATRLGMTVDHIIIYPGDVIIINGRGGFSKSLVIQGMSLTTKKAFQDFLTALSMEAK